MSEAQQTNPAQRASVFVDQFRAYSGSDTSHRVRHTLASMYDLHEGDTSSLMLVISEAWQYPVRIRENLERVGLDADPFKHIFDDLEKFLSLLVLGSVSSSVRSNIPPNLSASLGVISAILNRDSAEPLLQPEKIQEFIDSLEKIEREIKSADFEPEFVDYLTHRIDELKYALNHYETLGADLVIDRVDKIFGGVFRQFNKADTKAKTNVLSRLMGVAAAVVLALNLINGGFELSDNLTTFIDKGQPLDAEIIESNTIDPSRTKEKNIA